MHIEVVWIHIYSRTSRHWESEPTWEEYSKCCIQTVCMPVRNKRTERWPLNLCWNIRGKPIQRSQSKVNPFCKITFIAWFTNEVHSRQPDLLSEHLQLHFGYRYQTSHFMNLQWTRLVQVLQQSRIRSDSRSERSRNTGTMLWLLVLVLVLAYEL